MKRTDDISNLFNRFGASADSYLEFGSHFEYKEKPLALVPTAPERVPVVEVDQPVFWPGDQAPADSAQGVESPLALVNSPAPAAPLRHLLAEVALARQAEAQARNEEALRQALPQGRPAKTKARVIALVSAKGGVGKSTLATNLAGYFARAGHRVMLGDIDRQQSSRAWLKLRSPALPPIASWDIADGRPAKPPKNTTHVVLDTPAGLHGKQLTQV